MSDFESSCKRCFKCGVSKSRTDFYPHPRMTDGLLGKCKECTRKDVASNRKKRKEQYDTYEEYRNLSPARRAKHLEYQRRSRARHPDRYKAYAAVSWAVRTKKLLKEPCAVCGNKQSQAHHFDYRFPLVVMWLCWEHHMLFHDKEAA